MDLNNIILELNNTLKTLKDLYQVRHIYLYGSCARGEANEYSAIDLLIVVQESDLSFIDRLCDFRARISGDKLSRKLNILIYTEDEMLSMLEREEAYIVDALNESIEI